MGANKHLLMLMQEKEIATTNFLPTKKEIQKTSKEFVGNLLESGEINEMEIYTQALRITEALSVVTDELKNCIPLENFEAFGVKGTYRNGGDTLNVKEDPVYLELENKLKQRAELVKLATKTHDPIYDSEGIEVPKVSSTPRKSSLIINY
jgi:hypothetical protein